ncbi:hypothetical protein FHX74_003249 [Friedmanniella endophytica]|uniref:Uncharacterized protein n=1 Tax=Microlunatus kandeliicorticis TaxID=1759536 RepID=A0A7W3P738_9ACTN|nr:PPA1309 family protein [Microlunatus kandeliicorticis]MBA8795613.1 hypothetical protein [Microlunatus kandeliicorticis]
MTTPDAPDVPDPDDREALVAALVDLEHHLATAGWDAAPRLFALVRTDDLIEAEPELARAQGLRGSADGGFPDALTAIEQDEFRPTGDLGADLAAIVWPEAVHGCAVSLESTFRSGPDDADPEPTTAGSGTEEVRVVVGVTRAGSRHGLARLKSQPGELLAADELVPQLVTALAHTLADTPEGPTGPVDG